MLMRVDERNRPQNHKSRDRNRASEKQYNKTIRAMPKRETTDGLLTREQIDAGITEAASHSVPSSTGQGGHRIGRIIRPKKGTILLRTLNNM